MNRMVSAALLVLAVGTGAKAEELMPTGSYLYEQCTSEVRGQGLACTSYIAGVMQAMTFLGSVSPTSVPQTCEDPDTSIGDVKAGFLRWATAHKNDLHRNAADLLIAANIDLHPCAQAQNTPRIMR